MKTIRQFHPLEALLLLYPKPNWRAASRIIIADLLARNILEIYELPEEKGKAQYASYQLRSGPEGANYVIAPHERPILKYFTQVPDGSLQLKVAIKMMRQNSTAFTLYQSLLEGPPLRPYIHRGWWHRVINSYRLTDDGQRKRDTMRAELQALSDEFQELLAKDSSEAAKFVQGLGAYAMLLPEFMKADLPNLLAQLQAAWDEIPSLGNENLNPYLQWAAVLLILERVHPDPQTHSGHNAAAGCSTTSSCSGDGGTHHWGDGHGCGGDSGCSGGGGGGDSGCGGGGCSGCGGGCGGCGGCGS